MKVELTMKRIFLVTLCSGLLVSCGLYTRTEFKPWTNSAPQIGQGGTMSSFNGFEYWQYGAPDRPFRILGVMEQSRPGGIGGQILFEQHNQEELQRQLALLGANGIIEVDRRESLSGLSMSRNYGTGGYDIQSHSRVNKVLVAFKYLP